MKRLSLFIILCTLLLSFLALCSSGNGVSRDTLRSVEQRYATDHYKLIQAVEEIRLAELELITAARLGYFTQDTRALSVTHIFNRHNKLSEESKITEDIAALHYKSAKNRLQTANSLLAGAEKNSLFVYTRLYLSQVTALGEPLNRNLPVNPLIPLHTRFIMHLLICRLTYALIPA